MSRRLLALIAAGPALATAVALALLDSGLVVPSWLRDPLDAFVQPGVSVWWLVLAGPFRALPSSATDIAVAALANAALWSLLLWVLVIMVRALRRRGAASRP